MELSTILAINGMAATTKGTIVALEPVLFPTNIRVNGISKINRIKNGTLLTTLAMISKILYKILFGINPSLSETANKTPMGSPNRYPKKVDNTVMYSVSPIPFKIICVVSGVHIITRLLYDNSTLFQIAFHFFHFPAVFLKCQKHFSFCHTTYIFCCCF